MDKRKLVETNIRLYKNCSDLPIRRFDIIYKTKDLRFLCLDYDGYNEVSLPKTAHDTWKKILNEWVELCDDNTISYYYQLILEVAYLETRYYVSKEMLHQIHTRYPKHMSDKALDMYIVELKKWRYSYNKKNDVLDEIHRLMKQHKASYNKLGIKKSELEVMQKKNEHEQENTLEAQAVILEQITGKNNIDIDTTSVLKWIEIGKLATNINEKRRKNE